MFEPEVLRKQTYCTEEVLVTLLGGAPRSDSVPHSNSAPGELCPLAPPRYASAFTKFKVFCPLSFEQLYLTDVCHRTTV